MSNKTNLILDLSIFTAFLAVASPRLTGNSIHEWLSIAFAATIITHLLFHWKWIVKVTSEYFKKFLHQSRLNYFVDLLFFISMTFAIFSGILISRDVLGVLNIQLEGVSRSWRFLHSFSSDLSVILLGIHIALHWKWIVTNVGNLFRLPSFKRAPAQKLAAQPVTIDEEH